MTAFAALTEPFDGTNGVAISTSNTSITQVTGGGTAKFLTSDKLFGSSSVEIACSGANEQARWDFTAQNDLWIDFCFKVTVLDAGNVGIAVWYNGANKVGDLQVSYVDASHFTLRLRDNNTARWTSSNLSTSTWYRVQVYVNPGSATGHRVYVYNTATSDTADQDSGGVTATANGQTQLSSWRMGVISSSTMTVRFDDVQADDAQLVSRATSIASSAVWPITITWVAAGSVGTTDAHFVKVSGSWESAPEQVRVSGSWQ